MPPRPIFLDHLSSTPVDPRVFEAMKPYFTEVFGNPSSLHRYGLQVRDALLGAREQFASLVNAASPEDILLTSGGTEANNLAIKGVAYANQRKGNHLVLCETEHPSVLESVAFLEKNGFTSTKVPVTSEGILRLDKLREAITDKTILIAVHHANHDIGAIQPIAEVGKIAAERGVAFFCDATASAGWVPIDVQAMGVHLLSFAPHRFYGPKGVGVLYRNRKARLVSILHGGVQENGRRAGTENVPAIVGGGLAAELARKELPQRAARVQALQKRMLDGLAARVPYLKFNGPPCGPLRSPTNVSLATEFIEGEGQLLLLDHFGVCVASGGSCVSKSLKVSHVLSAIGLDHALAQGSIIMTLGKENTEEEVDEVIETMAKVVEKLRGMSPMWDEFQRGKIDSTVSPRGIGKSFTEHAAAVSGHREERAPAK
jgi:cysteine desulfurase